MAHRENRDRGAARDWERTEREDRPRRERDAREPNRDRDRERDRDTPRGGLNEFFVDGEGIHREVMQREICKYLGSEAYSRPGSYNGASGYFVTAIRPFTQKMVEDLQALSREFMSENRDLSRRGYEGVSYPQSQTSRQFDRTRQDSNPEVYNDPRYNQSQPAYPATGAQPGYVTSANYSPGANYQSTQMQGYEPGPAYPQVGGYPVGSSYPQVSGYPSASGYPTASGYAAGAYPAPTGRAGNLNDPHYVYNTAGDYPNQQYRQQNPFPSVSRPGEPIIDPTTRAGPPRFQQFGTTQAETSIRGAAYDAYNQPIAPGQAARGTFAAPRGAPTGYDGQQLDGSHTLERRR